MKFLRGILFPLALYLGTTSIAGAAPYPEQPIRLVVPFGAGSGADIVARQIAQSMALQLRQPVVVENKTGAGGNIAAGQVAKAAADGYTIMLGSTGPLTVNASLYDTVPYDPLKDFSPISVVAIGPMVIAVRADSPIKNLGDLVARAARSAKPLSYGSSGIGSGPHLAALLLERSTGISMTHIPYRGTADAVNDLLGGSTDMAFSGVPTVLPSVQAGKIRILAASADNTIPALSEVPTTVQAGYKDTDLAVFYGLVAPAGTPREIIDTLNAAVVRSVADAEMKARFATLGLMPHATTSAQFFDLIKTDSARWHDIIKSSNMTAE